MYRFTQITSFVLFYSRVGLANATPIPLSSPSCGNTTSNITAGPTWHTLAPIADLPRQEHTTLFLPPSTIAILGGIIPSNDPSLEIPVITTGILQFYCITTNTWTSLFNSSNTTETAAKEEEKEGFKPAPLPLPLNHANAAVVAGKIYVLGGLAERNTPLGRDWHAVPDSFVYDAATNVWSSLPAGNLPAGEERGSAAVGVRGDVIYLAGGMTSLEFYGNHTQSSVDVVSAFDTRTLEWIEIPEQAKRIPAARDHAGIAVVGSQMYVLGGRDKGQANKRDTVFMLDLEDLEKGWSTSKARMPTPRGGVATGVVGSKVYTFGGEGNSEAESGVFVEIEAYDAVEDSWERVAGGMKVPRHGTYAVEVGGKVYIPGGGVVQSGGPVADFDVFLP